MKTETIGFMLLNQAWHQKDLKLGNFFKCLFVLSRAMGIRNLLRHGVARDVPLLISQHIVRECARVLKVKKDYRELPALSRVKEDRILAPVKNVIKLARYLHLPIGNNNAGFSDLSAVLNHHFFLAKQGTALGSVDRQPGEPRRPHDDMTSFQIEKALKAGNLVLHKGVLVTPGQLETVYH